MSDKPHTQEKSSLQTDTRDARRIMACLNACAGIPTEDLEDAAGEETQWQRLELLADDAKWYANKEDQT